MFKNKILWFVIGAVVIVACLVAFFVFTKKKTFSAKGLVEIDKTSGYSGYGKVTVKINHEKKRDILKELTGAVSDAELESKPEFREKGMVIDKAITIREEEFKGVSNGDKIKVIVDVDKAVADKYKFELTDLETELEVSGLEEVAKSMEDLSKYKEQLDKDVYEEVKKKIDIDFSNSYIYRRIIVGNSDMSEEEKKAYSDHFPFGFADDETNASKKCEITPIKEGFCLDDESLKEDKTIRLNDFNSYCCLFKIAFSDKNLSKPVEFYVCAEANGLLAGEYKKDGKNVTINMHDKIDESGVFDDIKKFRTEEEAINGLKEHAYNKACANIEMSEYKK